MLRGLSPAVARSSTHGYHAAGFSLGFCVTTRSNPTSSTTPLVTHNRRARNDTSDPDTQQCTV